MARYDLSVSPHSLATFTNSTGFPAKLENSTRRPDSAVAWKSCSCIDAGAVVSLIIKREYPASAALPKCAYRAFALRRNEYARMGATNTANIFPKNCQTTLLLRRPTVGLWYQQVPTPLPHEYTHFSSFRLKVTKFGSRTARRIETVPITR